MKKTDLDILLRAAKAGVCKQCPLKDNTMVTFETNDIYYDQIVPVKVAFIGLNPGTEEANYNRPFIGRSGRKLRDLIDTFCLDSYLLTNIILCSTANEQEIPNVQQVVDNCKFFSRVIIKQFCPQLIVPVGRHAAQVCNVPDNITRANGYLYHGNIIPVIHPSAMLRNAWYAADLNAAFSNIRRFLEKLGKEAM